MYIEGMEGWFSSSRGPRFEAQHAHGPSSLLSLTTVSGDQMTSFGLLRTYQIHK